MPNWPPTVPFFTNLRGLRGSGPQEAVIRSPVSVGPAKVRRRTSAATRARSGATPKISPTQFATFEEFFHDDLLDGSLSFDVDDCFDGKSGTFRFVGTYEFEWAGSGYIVTAELERLP